MQQHNLNQQQMFDAVFAHMQRQEEERRHHSEAPLHITCAGGSPPPAPVGAGAIELAPSSSSLSKGAKQRLANMRRKDQPGPPPPPAAPIVVENKPAPPVQPEFSHVGGMIATVPVQIQKHTQAAPLSVCPCLPGAGRYLNGGSPTDAWQACNVPGAPIKIGPPQESHRRSG
jgi:hypothetical protein